MHTVPIILWVGQLWIFLSVVAILAIFVLSMNARDNRRRVKDLLERDERQRKSIRELQDYRRAREDEDHRLNLGLKPEKVELKDRNGQPLSYVPGRYQYETEDEYRRRFREWLGVYTTHQTQDRIETSLDRRILGEQQLQQVEAHLIASGQGYRGLRKTMSMIDEGNLVHEQAHSFIVNGRMEYKPWQLRGLQNRGMRYGIPHYMPAVEDKSGYRKRVLAYAVDKIRSGEWDIVRAHDFYEFKRLRSETRVTNNIVNVQPANDATTFVAPKQSCKLNEKSHLHGEHLYKLNGEWNFCPGC